MADDNDDDDEDDEAKGAPRSKGNDNKGKKSPIKKTKKPKSGDEDDEEGKGDWETWALLYDMEDRVNEKVRKAIRSLMMILISSAFIFFEHKYSSVCSVICE